MAYEHILGDQGGRDFRLDADLGMIEGLTGCLQVMCIG